MIPFLKICVKCQKQKWNNLFSKNPKHSDGLQSRCKNCISEYDSKRRRDPKQRRRESLKLRYNILPDQFILMLKKQNGVCAICKQFEIKKDSNGQIQPLSVDHCHLTGKIRGLLCHNCNVLLGHAKNDPKTLREAANYVEQSQKQKCLA